ncbi:hypothetical protein QM012_002456 [Aureobasidium pullulans]|uniref:Sushi domain-containing protein n=1 Tax=Aureobasidium pullulans TaxID=5580 RepID=A0ABR0TBZ7_AURPU
MRLSNICAVLMAIASSVYGQNEDFDPNDIEPGHLGGLSKLPHEIQRCIKLNMPLAWVDYEQQLDLFCDHSTGTWHQTIPSCLSENYPSEPSTAISIYNTFTSILCRGWEAPGLPLTTILSTDGTTTTSTIFPTSSETKYLFPEFTPRYTTSKSRACIWGHDNCWINKPTSLYSTKSKSAKWTKSRHRLLASTTPWGVETRPVSTGAMFTK